MHWLLLFVAIVFEVIGTAALKLSDGVTRLIPSIMMIVSYGAAIRFTRSHWYRLHLYRCCDHSGFFKNRDPLMKSKIFLLVLLLHCSGAFAAAFKCAEAKTKIENLICKNESISSLDEKTSSLYSSLIKNYSDASAIKLWQKNWLIQRNACGDEKCLAELYRQRISHLELALTASPAARKWTGNYTRYVSGKKDSDSSEVLLIALDKNKILVEGSSIWVGNATTGNVNVAQLQGVGVLNGSILQETVAEELCSAKLILTINNTLAIIGESGCGGMNVTFNGEYRRN
jgi:uncharacterized protein